MAINKIKVSNFKSFRDLEVNLGNFNVLIGANASGKSNFIQVFKFLIDITNYGLDNAVSMQGGVEYLSNVNIGQSSNLSLEIVCDQESIFAKERGERIIGVEIYEEIYKFAMKFGTKGPGFKIAEDTLIQKCRLIEFEEQKNQIKEKEQLGSGEIITSRVNGEAKLQMNLPPGVPIKKRDVLWRLFPPFVRKERLKPTSLLLDQVSFLHPLRAILKSISIYDFDPRLPKKGTPITGKAELEEDGSNLAIVLKNIIQDKEKGRKLSNLVRDVLPFVDALAVEKFADKSLLFKLRETYSKERYLPAAVASDGTINIISLIIALYFERKLLAIIEEPERNIHPYLISKVTNMMKDASRTKQIIVSTHHPEVVKHADLEDLLLVSRDHKGFSTISRPAEKDEVKIFLKNELGIEDLYVQNLLGM